MSYRPDPSATRCTRSLSGSESLVVHAGLDACELGCLVVLRKFCQSFTPQGRDAWMNAFRLAEHVWGPSDGPVIACRLMHVLQAMRASRMSMFSFSSPDCASCCQILTEHERRLITAIRFVCEGRPKHAALQMMLLCEGNDTDDIMERLESLAGALSGPVAAGVPPIAAGGCCG